MDLAIVIPVQQGGHDLIRNALAPFGEDGIPLVVWKIRQLKTFLESRNIYVSTNSLDVQQVVKSECVSIHHRSKTLEEESKGSIGNVICGIAQEIDHEYIAWVSSVLPFMSEYDYRRAVQCFEDHVIEGSFDSLMSVNRIDDYLWNEVGPLNYCANAEQPNRTELGATFRVTNGLFIRSRKDTLEHSYYVGSNVYKFEVSKLAGLDINAQADLEVARALSDVYLKQQSQRNSVVFLDFDGVIFDSAAEAYAMAMITTKRIKTLDELQLDSDHASRFFAQRYLIGPAWNYFYLLCAIEIGEDENFADYLPSEAGEEAKEFQVAFFATRQVIRNNFWNQWLQLNRLYEGADKFIDIINQNNNVVIVTTKDEPTVKALLDCHGLERTVDIFDSKSYEKFGGKSNFMDDYIRRKCIERATFVDDSRQHLDKCNWVDNLDVIQARWGYVSVEERQDNKHEVFKKIEETLGYF